jgi:hypothetical protein
MIALIFKINYNECQSACSYANFVLVPLTGILMIISAVPFFTYRYLQEHTSVDTALRIKKILKTLFFVISISSISSASVALIFLGLQN